MPPNKMERFTARARRILGLAQQAAEEWNHSLIGTEHLLIALLREDGGVAGRVLRDLGLQERYVEQLIELMPHDALRPNSTALELSPDTKRVIELTVDEARRMGHHYIGTEHILLALVRQSDGAAIDILKRCDIAPELVRRQTRKVLQELPPQPAETETSAGISAAKNPTLQLSVTDIPTGARKFDLTLPLAQTETLLNAIHFLLNKGENGKAILDDSDHAQRIEIILKSDIEQSESGAAMSNSNIERFTQRAQVALNLAQKAAEQLQHTYIGTEHLLLGLMREEGGVAGRVLRDFNLELPRVEKLVEELSRAPKLSKDATPDLSPGVKRVLELAVDEARRMKHPFIGTEHLLLGLVRQSEGVAIDILKRCGLQPEDVRRETRRVIQEGPPVSSPPPSSVETPPPARIRAAKNSILHLGVTDTTTGALKFEMSLPFDQMQAMLRLLEEDNARGVVVEDSDHAQRIEIILKSEDLGDSDA